MASLATLLEDQTREFWNMSETKTNQVILSDSSHAKLVEGVERLKTFIGISVSESELLDMLIDNYLRSYLDKYVEKSHELVDLKARMEKLEGAGYRAFAL